MFFWMGHWSAKAPIKLSLHSTLLYGEPGFGRVFLLLGLLSLLPNKVSGYGDQEINCACRKKSIVQMAIRTKICGIKTQKAAEAAADAGADLLGFVYYQKSPRHISLSQAELLGPKLPSGPSRVGVFVDADHSDIKIMAKALWLDYLQLHGSETIVEAAALKDLTGCKIIKCFAVAERADLIPARAWSGVADMVLFDAKPPAGSELPGGNAICFPWEIMQGFAEDTPWLLAGGLTVLNVSDAVWASGAKGVDVSSGVESAPGIKDTKLIKAFLDRTGVL